MRVCQSPDQRCHHHHLLEARRDRWSRPHPAISQVHLEPLDGRSSVRSHIDHLGYLIQCGMQHPRHRQLGLLADHSVTKSLLAGFHGRHHVRSMEIKHRASHPPHQAAHGRHHTPNTPEPYRSQCRSQTKNQQAPCRAESQAQEVPRRRRCSVPSLSRGFLPDSHLLHSQNGNTRDDASVVDCRCVRRGAGFGKTNPVGGELA
mmetsp:Transcript_101584/g.296124  ORF Transcript_101584/g.296124 Transcript_101584/m.296124 type:complete len:203 (+) Transcript_101584:1895-2503(+)